MRNACVEPINAVTARALGRSCAREATKAFWVTILGIQKAFVLFAWSLGSVGSACESLIDDDLRGALHFFEMLLADERLGVDLVDVLRT